jgi:hypothetical protein
MHKKPFARPKQWKCVRFQAYAVTLALVCLCAQVRAETADATLFSRACIERIPNVQQDRRTCVVGIAHDGNNVDVLVSTRDALAVWFKVDAHL